MDFLIKTMRPAPYQATYEAMQAFTANRTTHTPDEIWLCEHPPVYTLGLAGKAKHVLNSHEIAVVQTNRGGQVTYHGPGQIVAYVLMDMRRTQYYVREYVQRLEQAVIATLKAYGVHGFLIAGAPGIYVGTTPFNAQDQQAAQSVTLQASNDPNFTGVAKISALGVKVSNHCTYHGVALNVNMDLRPFEWINPCGYAGLVTTDLKTSGVPMDEHSWEQIAKRLSEELVREL